MIRRMTAAIAALALAMAGNPGIAETVIQTWEKTAAPAQEAWTETASGQTDQRTARDISEFCTYNGKQGGPSHRLNDGAYANVFTTGPKDGAHAVYITVTEGEPIGALYVQWAGDSIPAAVQVPDGDGWRTVATSNGDFYADYIPVPECVECRLICRDNPMQQLSISELRVLTAGTPDEHIQVWRKAEGKVDMILINGHPDDELLWFGGTLPYYAGERGKDILVICCAMSANIRKLELCDALWACGVRVHPIYMHRLDFSAPLREMLQKWHAEDEVCDWVTGYYRRFKPDVVVLHDINGEYGHGTHRAASWIGMHCVEQAKDPEIWPESAALYGTWNVPKVYVHLWEENQIRMDWNQPLSAFDGRTAIEVAAEALEMHKSQTQLGWNMEKGAKYDNTLFGLYYSTVGPDVAKNDFFENIE